MIVGQIACGASIDALLDDYPYLEREDILQALRYAAWRADLDALLQMESELDRGALLSIDPAGTRLRLLPLQPK
jgi:hypothetical protein